MSVLKSTASHFRHFEGFQRILCSQLVNSSESRIQRPVLQTAVRHVSTSSHSSFAMRAAQVDVTSNVSSSSMAEESTSERVLPTKETLLRIDWLLEHLTPGILKSRLKPFFDICQENVEFNDTLFSYNISKRSQLLSHIAKIRMYYRYLSPYNKVERIGSCVYEGEDVIVLLWRLSTLESNLWSYFPSFITKREPKITTIEGALDVHVTPEGQVYKLVNRKITAADREGARIMANVKEQQEDIRKKEEDKEKRRVLEEMVEDQKRRGLM